MVELICHLSKKRKADGGIDEEKGTQKSSRTNKSASSQSTIRAGTRSSPRLRSQDSSGSSVANSVPASSSSIVSQKQPTNTIERGQVAHSTKSNTQSLQDHAQRLFNDTVKRYQCILEEIGAASKLPGLEDEIARLDRRRNSYHSHKSNFDVSTKRRDQYAQLIIASQHTLPTEDFNVLDPDITADMNSMLDGQTNIRKRLEAFDGEILENKMTEARVLFKEASTKLTVQNIVVENLRRKRDQRLAIAEGMKDDLCALSAIYQELKE